VIQMSHRNEQTTYALLERVVKLSELCAGSDPACVLREHLSRGEKKCTFVDVFGCLRI
jgi:hypothetical protein